MVNVQVRDVSEDVHAELARRAERAGQSLQQFLSEQLTRIATTPSLNDVLDRLQQRELGELSVAEARKALEDERAGR